MCVLGHRTRESEGLEELGPLNGPNTYNMINEPTKPLGLLGNFLDQVGLHESREIGPIIPIKHKS